MRYFSLREDARIANRVKIAPFERNGQAQVQMCDISDKVRYTDFMESPHYIFSENMKVCCAKLSEEIQWTAFALVDDKSRSQVLYFVPKLPVLDCISEQSQFVLSGKLKRLIIDKSKIADEKMFLVKTEKEKIMLVNLEVAEELLRHDFYGFKLECAEHA